MADINGVFLGVSSEGTGADPQYIRKRRTSDRIYAASPGGTRSAPILIEDFDLSHLAWMDRANCRGTDPEAFFPDKGENVTATVRAICGSCPVQQTCLEYGLERPQLKGVWGGLGDEERNRIRERDRSKEKRQRARRHAAP